MPEQGCRPRLLLHLEARPGSSPAQLARALGVNHSTIVYHLARLERAGEVGVLRWRGRLFVFLSRVPPRERALVVALAQPRAARVLARLGPGPRALGEVAAGLPLSKAGVLWHLRRLVELGLAVAEGAPRAQRYRLAVVAAGPALTSVPAAASG